MASDCPGGRRRRSGDGGRAVRLPLVYPPDDADHRGRLTGWRGPETRVGAGKPARRSERAGTAQAGGNHKRARSRRSVFVGQDRPRRRAGRRRRPVAGAGRRHPRPRGGVAGGAPGILDRRHRGPEARQRRSGRRRNQSEGRRRSDPGIRSGPRQCDVPQPRARGDASGARRQGSARDPACRSPGGKIPDAAARPLPAKPEDRAGADSHRGGRRHRREAARLRKLRCPEGHAAGFAARPERRRHHASGILLCGRQEKARQRSGHRLDGGVDEGAPGSARRIADAGADDCGEYRLRCLSAGSSGCGRLLQRHAAKLPGQMGKRHLSGAHDLRRACLRAGRGLEIPARGRTPQR